MRTFASMRRGRARSVHPLRRPDLRRRADRRDRAARRRIDVAQPGRGRRRRRRPDPRPVPRPLPLQPARRAPARASTRRCRWSRSGTTTRSSTTGTRPRCSAPPATKPATPRSRSRCWRRGPSRRSSTTRPSAPTAAIRGRSTASCVAARWPTCSSSTAAPIAARTPPTSRPRPDPTPRCWLRRSAPGSRRRWPDRRATWKIIACDQPIGVVVPDGPLQEGFANADPRTLGREHEVAALLVGDQAAAHPQRAVRHRRRPLRGRPPLRPVARDLDRLRSVLGVRRRAAPRRHLRPGRPRRDVRSRGGVHVGRRRSRNRPPSDDLQFFGQVAIDPTTRAATVTLHDREGRTIFTKALEPAG